MIIKEILFYTRDDIYDYRCIPENIFRKTKQKYFQFIFFFKVVFVCIILIVNLRYDTVTDVLGNGEDLLDILNHEEDEDPG
jgi:hypothetical protein